MKAEIKVLSNNCVNSNWSAGWKGDVGERCQCGYKCKKSVSVKRNGHTPYIYIIDEQEYDSLVKEQKKGYETVNPKKNSISEVNDTIISYIRMIAKHLEVEKEHNQMTMNVNFTPIPDPSRKGKRVEYNINLIVETKQDE